MKFAYMIMGERYGETSFEFAEKAQIPVVSVPNIDEACEAAKKLAADGVDVIELCGAFDLEKATAVKDATEGKIGVAYSIHHPDLDEVFGKLFGPKK